MIQRIRIDLTKADTYPLPRIYDTLGTLLSFLTSHIMNIKLNEYSI